MKWTTKDGIEMEIENMPDGHTKRVINMLIRRHSPQLILECILVGKESLLKEIENKKSFNLSGDMAQQFNDNYPGDESDSWDYDPRWDPNYL